MITIRLQRRGRKNDPSFRVIVTDSKSGPQSGKYHEMVGSYDPRVDRVELKAERIKHWIEHGAKTSDTVHNLLVSKKIIDAKKINVLPKKTVPKKDLPAQAGEPAAEAAAPVQAQAEESDAVATPAETETSMPAPEEAAAESEEKAA